MARVAIAKLLGSNRRAASENARSACGAAAPCLPARPSRCASSFRGAHQVTAVAFPRGEHALDRLLVEPDRLRCPRRRGRAPDRGCATTAVCAKLCPFRGALGVEPDERQREGPLGRQRVAVVLPEALLHPGQDLAVYGLRSRKIACLVQRRRQSVQRVESVPGVVFKEFSASLGRSAQRWNGLPAYRS